MVISNLRKHCASISVRDLEALLEILARDFFYVENILGQHVVHMQLETVRN